uniref:Uncharacterized protein n=1 Tax=Anopheles funestus TaxID=62324 RepID=A0A182RDM7_ANOFN
MENSCTQNKATCYELFPQELPNLDAVPSLEAELRKGAMERLASRKFVAQQKRAEKRRFVPTVSKLVHPNPPKCQKCQHSGNFILDRQILEPSDHIDFIARPKEVMQRKRPYYVDHKLSSATNRIKTLARPGALHVKTTLEKYTKLSPEHEQHLKNLLEPKPFVTIMESIGYAKQQRSDDAVWRRHMANQERKLLHKIHYWEIEHLKIVMEALCKKLKDYYLSPSAPPLTEEGVQISRSVLRIICRFLDIAIPHADEQENGGDNDVIDDFYVELSKKIGFWTVKIMAQTGITFDKQKSFSYVRKSESFVSVNSSVFQLDLSPIGDDAVAVAPTSILSLEIIYDCVDAAVATVEKGICERRNSVCIESEEKILQEDTTRSAENEEESKPDHSIVIDIDASTHSNTENADQTSDDIDEDQVTVIENIPNEETDENEQEEAKQRQT